MTERAGDLELMQLHDGELPEADAARLAEECADDPASLALLADLDHIGDVVREFADQRGAAADSIADVVMARIEQERVAPVEDPHVPAWRRFAPVGAAVLAMAAAAVLVIQARAPYSAPSFRAAPSESAPAHQPVASNPTAEAVPAPAAPVATDDTLPSVAIESVDFGSRDGTIFMVQSGQNETPVVWLVDEPASPGARIEPL